MRYMLMHKLDENVPGNYDPSPEFQARMGRFMQEAYQAGVVLAAEGLHPTKVDSARGSPSPAARPRSRTGRSPRPRN
jgi:hypothetical protein